MSILFKCHVEGCDFRTDSMDKCFNHIDTHDGKSIISSDCMVCRLFLKKDGCKGKIKPCDVWCR